MKCKRCGKRMIGVATLEMLQRNLCVGCYFSEEDDDWKPLVDLVEESLEQPSTIPLHNP